MAEKKNAMPHRFMAMGQVCRSCGGDLAAAGTRYVTVRQKGRAGMRSDDVCLACFGNELLATPQFLDELAKRLDQALQKLSAGETAADPAADQPAGQV